MNSTELLEHLHTEDDQINSLGNVVTLLMMARIRFSNEVTMETRGEGGRATLDITPLDAGDHAALQAVAGNTGTLRMYGYPESQEPTGYSLLKSFLLAGESQSTRTSKPRMVEDKVASTGDILQDAEALQLILEGLVGPNNAHCSVELQEKSGLVKVNFDGIVGNASSTVFSLRHDVLALAFQPIMKKGDSLSDRNHGKILFEVAK